MANEIINDAVHDIRDLAKQAFSGLELTLQQSRDLDANVNVINEFATFISQKPDALSEQDKRDTIKQLNLVYDELVAYGLQSDNDTTRNLIAHATNSMFNLNSALTGSLTQDNSQQQTQAQTQKLNGLEMGVEVAGQTGLNYTDVKPTVKTFIM